MEPNASSPCWSDDQDLPPRETTARLLLTRAVAITALLAGTVYLGWRATSTLDGATWWLAWPLLILEAHALVIFALYVHVLWHPGSVRPPRPVAGRRHTVTVLVPTYNEPMEVLLPTLAAAAALPEAEAVWVLDDGNRAWVRDMARELGIRYRARRTHDHAKAGNINDALTDVTTDLVAVLDADHVPRPDFLSRLLGYFDDPSVALVQTPQSFYNTDSFEHMHYRGRSHGEQDLFYRVLAEARNRWGAAFWCGTNAIVRVSALREVGGVATETVTEDIHTTIRMHRAGWRTLYHNEVLAHGLAATNGEQFLNQRLRWGTGAMQVLRTDNPLTMPSLTKHQRLSYASTLLGWFDGWRTLGFVILPIATLFTGGLPVAAPMATFLVLFASAWTGQQIATQILARGRAPLWPSLVFDFVRMPAALLATTALFSARPRPFTVTVKGRTGQLRRRTKAPRLLVILIAASATSGAWYLATALGHTPLTYDIPWVAHASALWMLANAALLTSALRRIRSDRFAAERRGAVRFPSSVTVSVDGVPATVTDLSVTGARLTLDTAEVPDTLVTVDLNPLAPLHIRGVTRTRQPVRGGYQVGIEFTDLTVAERTQLVPTLFGHVPLPEPDRPPKDQTVTAPATLPIANANEAPTDRIRA